MQGTDTKTHRELVKKCVINAENQLDEGAFKQAEEILYQGLVTSPGSLDLLQTLGEVYRQSGRIDEASLCFRGVIPDAANEQFFKVKPNQPTSPEQAPATSILEAWPAEQRTLTPPRFLGKFGEFGQFNYTATHCLGSRTSLTAAGKIWFDGLNTVVFDRNDRIIPFHNKGNEMLASFVSSQHKPTHHKGRVCFLDARSSSIYYHWMLDVLPKLAVLEQSGLGLDEIDTFLIRTDHPFQLQTLTLAGIASEKIKLIEGEFHSADELLVPYLKNDLGEKIYNGLGMGLASWIPAWLQQLLTAAPHSSPIDAQRLFISRLDARTRRIYNQAELTELLDAYDIVSTTLSDLSVAEQASLFSQAKLVVGLHGAGLTNIAFCRPGTRIIELFGHYKVPCYWSLANLAGLDYANFICEDRIEQHRDGDIVVDLVKFEQALQSMI